MIDTGTLYDNPDRSKSACPKCGCEDTHCAWVAAEKGCGRGCHPPKAERFERTCRGCSYHWETFDVLTVDPVAVDQ